jgi:hypothetical protein
MGQWRGGRLLPALLIESRGCTRRILRGRYTATKPFLTFSHPDFTVGLGVPPSRGDDRP